MSTKPPDTDRSPSAAEICGRFPVSDEARKFLEPEMKPLKFLKELYSARLFVDSIRFIAYFLPKREAIWWGCLCVWKAGRPKMPEKDEAAMQSAVRWVLDPSEENRRQAEKAGKEAGSGAPAGGLALAAYMSGGSLGPPGQPDAPPKPFAAAKTVAAAVLLAALQGQAKKTVEYQKSFVALAAKVARGKNRWAEQTPAQPPAQDRPSRFSRRKLDL